MKADIVACYPKSLIGKIISFVTDCEVSHVAIMVDDEFIIESDWIGVRARKIKDMKRNYKILRCEGLTEFQKNKIINFVKNSLSTEYDFKLLIGLGFKKFFNINIKKYNDIKKYICTELIIYAYRTVGIELVDNFNNNLYPKDILNSDVLNVYKRQVN